MFYINRVFVNRKESAFVCFSIPLGMRCAERLGGGRVDACAVISGMAAANSVPCHYLARVEHG